MKTQRIRQILCLAFSVGLLLFCCDAYAENIDPDNDGFQYAWGENVGWLNLEPGGDGHPGVEVGDSNLTGFIWGENIGWISLSCENTDNCSDVNYSVVNDGDGNLSGYAWGENVGWINFFPASGGVYIDACGDFNGTAWGENVGWIKFRSDGDNPFHVRTSWTSPIDDVPPVTEIVDIIQEWFNSDVNITLTATDCGSGVNKVYYSLNGGDNVLTSGNSAAVTISDEGEYTLEYFSVDQDGNEEAPPNVVTFSIDKTPPDITITSPADLATFLINQHINADYTITDIEGSGVDVIVAPLEPGDPINTSVIGSYTFTVSATDLANNNNSVTHSYTIRYPGNIDTENKNFHYAYGENVGWINFKPSFGPGVTVTDSAVIGYAYGENIGWINLSCANNNSCGDVNYGVVNDGDGNLSGHAWCENTGWINFAPDGAGVKIDPGTGEFSGLAWAENIGWIKFRSNGPVTYGVTTSWPKDIDADGISIEVDNCPTVYNPDQTDINVDGYGDNCVSPDVDISRNVNIGDNPVIGNGCTIKFEVSIGNDAQIGKNVTINKNSYLGDSVVLGDGTVINANVLIGDNMVIGSNVTIGKNVSIGSEVHIGNNSFINQGVIIGDNVDIGLGVTIGSYAQISPGSVIPDGTVIEKNAIVIP